jgi:hypothetical protein
MKESLLEDLVDAACRVALFDSDWHDETIPEVKSNKDALRDGIRSVLRRHGITLKSANQRLNMDGTKDRAAS